MQHGGREHPHSSEVVGSNLPLSCLSFNMGAIIQVPQKGSSIVMSLVKPIASKISRAPWGKIG